MSDISEGEMVELPGVEGLGIDQLTEEQAKMIAEGKGDEVREQLDNKGGEQQKIRIGVVGDNAVAQAMQLAFDVKSVETMHVSGLEGIDDLFSG